MIINQKSGDGSDLKITEHEKKKYALLTDLDVEILKSCKELEKKKLPKSDKYLVKLIKSQLEHDWRKYLANALKNLSRK